MKTPMTLTPETLRAYAADLITGTILELSKEGMPDVDIAQSALAALLDKGITPIALHTLINHLSNGQPKPDR
jgi:hypothetical protein